MNIFVLALLIYLGYRFIAGFLIPLFRAGSHMRQQFQDINSRNNGQAGPGQPNGSAHTNASGSAEASRPGTSKVGEYIDFEEIK